MAVLVEGISVIVPVSVLKRGYPGGEQGYVTDVPNSTYCCDATITRVGFMSPADVGAFVRQLASHGIAYLVGSRARDLAVVDQNQGVLEPCDWLEFHTATLWAGPISIAAYTGTSLKSVSIPDAWDYQSSLSNPSNYVFVPKEAADSYPVIRRDAGKDVVRLPDGSEAYTARSVAPERDTR